ncbi:MAG: sensor domain-containing diguanylate cyclase [Methylophilaceae bacterium]
MNIDQNLAIIIALTVFVLLFGALGIFYALKLKRSEELWKFALEGAGDGVWDWDIKNNIAHFSERYKELFGLNDDEISSSLQIWDDRIHKDDLTSVKEALNNYLTGKTVKYKHEHRVICKDKSVKWVLSRGMVIKRDRNGGPLRMVGTHTDITDRKHLESQQKNLAHYDVLTNLPNRKLFNDRLKLALAYAKRENKMLAVMFIDLDLFKEINDQHGHSVGDMVLKKISQRLISCVRETDTVARLGGDEFVILLPNTENQVHIQTVATKILEATIKPIEIVKSSENPLAIDPKLRNLLVSASIGVAMYPQHGSSEKSLVANADMAMYWAKKNGKNQAMFFDKNMV